MNIEIFNRFLSSSNHFYSENGIWYAKIKGKISYPDYGYDTIFQVEDKSFWFQHRNNCIISLIKKYSGHELFFDVGGGNGVVTKALEDMNIHSVLLEPSRRGVANAKLRKLSNIVCGTLQDLAGLRGMISAVGAFDVIEHIKNDDAFVADINNILKVDGLFYVTVPAYPFLWSNEDVYAGHYRRYLLNEVINLIKRNNFEILYSTYFFSILLPPLFIYRTLRSKLGFHKPNTNTIKDHKQRMGITGSLLNAVSRWELSAIHKKRYIPFGTSCFVVGKKVIS